MCESVRILELCDKLERSMGGERAEGGDSHPWLEGDVEGRRALRSGRPTSYSGVGKRGLTSKAQTVSGDGARNRVIFGIGIGSNPVS